MCVFFSLIITYNIAMRRKEAQKLKTLALTTSVILFTLVLLYTLLPDLVPDDTSLTPPPMILIITQHRSGSSWLGSLFDAHPNVFYVFEPLHPKLYQTSAIALSTLEIQVKILRNICLCQFNTALASHGMADRSRVVVNSKRWINLGAPDGALLNQRCLASARTVVKVVRLTDVKVLQRLLYNEGCKVQIVHLIRDPRPSISSRMTTFHRFFPGEVADMPFTADRIAKAASVICSERLQMVSSLRTFTQASLTVKYEEIAEQPLLKTRLLFEWLHLDWSQEVQDYIIESSHGAQSLHGYDVIKNSTHVLQAWRTDMQFTDILAVEKGCTTLMRVLDYKPVNNINMPRTVT